MRSALELAARSGAEDEVPVGAVIVYHNEIVGTGRNRRETAQNALCHAEIEAINNACTHIGSWRLCDCDLYVTLEPCAMCAGAAVNARIRCIYFGAPDKRFGSLLSMTRLFDLPFNHIPMVESGILEQECSKILSDFFRDIRHKQKSTYNNGDIDK